MKRKAEPEKHELLAGTNKKTPFSILGYIDLSKRRVSATDIVKCEERYNKSKAVHSIMSTVAKKENKDMEALYQELAWPLYHKYGHAYDAFKVALKYVHLCYDRIKAQKCNPEEFLYSVQSWDLTRTPHT